MNEGVSGRRAELVAGCRCGPRGLGEEAFRRRLRVRRSSRVARTTLWGCLWSDSRWRGNLLYINSCCSSLPFAAATVGLSGWDPSTFSDLLFSARLVGLNRSEIRSGVCRGISRLAATLSCNESRWKKTGARSFSPSRRLLRCLKPMSQLRFDYDTTTTKNWHVHFLLASNRIEWKQARAIRRSRIVVVS